MIHPNPTPNPNPNPNPMAEPRINKKAWKEVEGWFKAHPSGMMGLDDLGTGLGTRGTGTRDQLLDSGLTQCLDRNSRRSQSKSSAEIQKNATRTLKKSIHYQTKPPMGVEGQLRPTTHRPYGGTGLMRMGGEVGWGGDVHALHYGPGNSTAGAQSGGSCIRGGGFNVKVPYTGPNYKPYINANRDRRSLFLATKPVGGKINCKF